MDENDETCCEDQIDFCGDCNGDNSCFSYPQELAGNWNKQDESLFSDSECTEQINCDADSFDACEAEDFCRWDGYEDDGSGFCMLEVMSPDIVDLYLDGTYDFKMGCNDGPESCSFEGTAQWGLKDSLCFVQGEEGWNCYSDYIVEDNTLEIISSDSDRCHEISYKKELPGCMDGTTPEGCGTDCNGACNYNPTATLNDGSCDYNLSTDSEGNECCSYALDACGVCNGNNLCMSTDLTESEYVGETAIVSNFMLNFLK